MFTSTCLFRQKKVEWCGASCVFERLAGVVFKMFVSFSDSQDVFGKRSISFPVVVSWCTYTYTPLCVYSPKAPLVPSAHLSITILTVLLSSFLFSTKLLSRKKERQTRSVFLVESFSFVLCSQMRPAVVYTCSVCTPCASALLSCCCSFSFLFSLLSSIRVYRAHHHRDPCRLSLFLCLRFFFSFLWLLVVLPGVRQGMQMRIPNQGHMGYRGGKPGHLFVVVSNEESPS